MKYKLIIDKNAYEEIIAIVHAPSSLTQRIEDLVCGYSGADSIMGYSDDEMRKVFDSTKDENGKKHVPIKVHFIGVGILEIPDAQTIIDAKEEIRKNPPSAA